MLVEAVKLVEAVYGAGDVKHKKSPKLPPPGEATLPKRVSKKRVPKVETLECTLCEPTADIPRIEFVEHVRGHGEIE